MDIQVYSRTMMSFLGKIKRAAIEKECPITGWRAVKANYNGPLDTQIVGEPYDISIGDVWFYNTLYFNNTIKIDTSFHGKHIYLDFQNDGESLLYLNDIPVEGFDMNRSLFDLGFGKEQEIKLSVESTVRWQNMAHSIQNGVEYPQQIFKKANIVAFYEEVEQCYYDLECILEHYLQYQDSFCFELLEYARLHLKPDDKTEAFLAQSKQVGEFIAQALARNAVLKQGKEILMVGHSHLDIAYLWPTKETIRKCGRTFSNMLYLMDHYSDFHFTQSQTYLYIVAKKYYPDLYKRICAYVREGRWEIVGGMYVEPDGNMPSGESFIRQLLHGLKYIEEEFGKKVEIGWLPDTFGLSAILPQIFYKCGIKYFYSTKLRNNQHYEFPYSVYEWEGLDGSRVLANLDVYGSYAGQMTIKQIADGEKYYKQKDVYNKKTMYLCGFGDGGGGVTKEMIERSKRYNQLSAVPKIRMSTAKEYFDSIENAGVKLPVWSQEHYYDLHQGTLTSQAALKKANRKNEFILRDVEILGVLSKMGGKDTKILKELWETVLLNQFHDILPGSCQREVAVQALNELQMVEQKAELLINNYVDTLKNKEDQNISKITVYNTLSFERNDYITISIPYNVGKITSASDGEAVRFTKLNNGNIIFYAENIPPMGYKVFIFHNEAEEKEAQKKLAKENENEFILENKELCVKISKLTGVLVSVYDKTEKRETLLGKGNCLQLFDEAYDFYDAWNINECSLRYPTEIEELSSIELTENNELMAKLRIERHFSNSHIVQTIVFYHDRRRVDFETEIDWFETLKMLRVAFDTDIHATKAVYDLSYGNIERSTKNNTDYDRSQIEVVGHKWAELADAGYGFAVLNDCKYGYSIKDKRVALTLLKAPKYPDKECDMGHHSFTYSIYVHKGDFRRGATDREAYSLNVPVLLSIANNGLLENEKSYLQVSSCSVFVEAIKYAWDGSGDIIIRAFENHGTYGETSIYVEFAKAVWECDMLENIENQATLNENNIITVLDPMKLKHLE